MIEPRYYEHTCNAWCRPPTHCDRILTRRMVRAEVEADLRRRCAVAEMTFISLEPALEAPLDVGVGQPPVDAAWLLTWMRP